MSKLLYGADRQDPVKHKSLIIYIYTSIGKSACLNYYMAQLWWTARGQDPPTHMIESLSRFRSHRGPITRARGVWVHIQNLVCHKGNPFIKIRRVTEGLVSESNSCHSECLISEFKASHSGTGVQNLRELQKSPFPELGCVIAEPIYQNQCVLQWVKKLRNDQSPRLKVRESG